MPEFYKRENYLIDQIQDEKKGFPQMEGSFFVSEKNKNQTFPAYTIKTKPVTG